MKVKNESGRDQFVTIRINGRRKVHTVGPSSTIEIPNDQGLALCKNSSDFTPADEVSKKIVDQTKPKPEPVKEARKRAGTTKRAAQDIQKGIKNKAGGE